MTTPLLSTKLYVPPSWPTLVPRPRLFDRWTAGHQQGCRLTLVSAPAGFGKTTVMAEWALLLRSAKPVPGSSALAGKTARSRIHTPGTMIAWLSLDQEDDDPSHFWTYLVAALQTADPEIGKSTLQLLRAPRRPAVQAVLTPLLNEVATHPGRIVLFLDDYHLISDKVIHESLAFWLDHQPPNCHLVIATRADPPLPTYRWRARGELTELRSDDLRFTPQEAAAYLHQVAGLALEPQEVEALEARTEGWIVGLQLAALAVKGRVASHRRDSARELISAFSGSHRYVLEYLTEEVVRRQPEAVREFLVRTSILDRLCGPLCDAVMGPGGRAQDAGGRARDAVVPAQDFRKPSLISRESSRSQEMLAELERRNLFLVPLDDERRWYRYHHLFADLLRNLLHRELPPERIAVLHRRASRWFEGEGEPNDAIQHALQANDFGRAASLIEAAAQGALNEGRLARLLGWTEALSPSVLRGRPRLGLYRAWALHLSGQSDAAARLLHEVKDLLRTLPPSPDHETLRGQAAALRTSVATVHGDMPRVAREGREALTYLPEEDGISRARVLVAIGTAYAYGDETAKATQTWRQARSLALEASNPFLATAATELLAGTQVYQQGRLRDGARTLQEAIGLGTAADGSRLPFTGTAHALLAEIHLEWDDRATAASYLEKGTELIHGGGIGYSLIYAYCTKARLQQAVGDAEGALKAIRSAERALESCPLWHMIIHLASNEVRLRLGQDDVETAARWARCDPATIGREIPAQLPIFLRTVQQIALARVYLAQKEAHKALATLDPLRSQAEASDRRANLIEILLVSALALAALGKTTAAQESLERSLTLAEPQGYVRLYLEEGQPVALLLRQAEMRGKSTAYARKLLAALSDEAGDLRMGVPADTATGSRARAVDSRLTTRTAPAFVEPLTPREHQVLRLICRGLSNREIAERLTVTLHTVKKHSSSIYGKLGVTSRTQAIVLARELGLC